MQDNVNELARDLLTHVRSLRDAGILSVARSKSSFDGDFSDPSRGDGNADGAVTSPARISASARTREDSAAQLSAIERELVGCELCRLSRGRQQIVFGTGNPDARILFVGEGPGKDEDESGKPFVGPAGQLLTDIIEKGMKIPRDEVYICNVVKCRPPGNRNPEEDEVASCRPFLQQQMQAVAPEVVIALGKFAAQTILGTTVPITRLRGNWQDYDGIPVMPTFHPAHLLRNPALKRDVWTDIQQVMRHLGMPGV